VRRWFQDALVEAWESLNVELLEIRDEGDGRIVQELRIRGRGRASGAEVDMRAGQTATIRNGLIVRRSIAAV
jgi:ketosteroid isomerase-like protein